MPVLFLLLLAAQVVPEDPLFRQRLDAEHVLGASQWVLLPHRSNYFLPVAYEHLQTDETFSIDGQDVRRNRVEAKFQLSVKVPLVQDLFLKRDAVYFAFTLQSAWQLYNGENSFPVRENDYEPEFFYTWTTDWWVRGWNLSVLGGGFDHQSNGRAHQFTRGWNRLIGLVAMARSPWVVALRPWFRFPALRPKNPNDIDGNPDITKYLGYGDLYVVYRFGRHEMGATIRNNLRWTNRGSLQLDWSFPVGRVHGYLQYFIGYGETLIDYNVPVGRIGVGMLLTRFM